jgi:hypothetical protein
MSYGRNFSSSQPLSRDSSQNSSNSTNGAPSEQFSSRSSSFGGGWRRPNSDSRPQSSGGGGWGRPQHAPTAASGGWGRSSFQRPPAAVGGGWGSRSVSEQASIQQTQQPQLQEKESSEQTAPLEGYDYEFLLYAFKQKYDLSDLSQDELPILDNLVMDHIHSNPLRYGQKLKYAIDRAFLKIHEDLQTKLRKTIPEKDSHPPAPTMCQEFILKLTTTLSSYGYTSPDHVSQFVAEYMRRPLSELVISDEIDKDTGNPMCLRSSQAYTEQHMSHAINTYFMTLDLRSIVRDRFGFVDCKMPSQLFRQLPSFVRNLIKSATCDNGRVVNGFLMVYPYGMQFNMLKKKLLESLITHSQQSNHFHIVSLTTKDRPTTGDICLVIPDKIYTQTKSEKDSASERVMTRKPGMSQYRTSGPRGCILLAMDQVLNWDEYGIQCSFKGTNMQLPMEQFCTILRSNSGAIPLSIEDEQMTTFSKELPEHDKLSIHDDTSSAGDGWGAAAPK